MSFSTQSTEADVPVELCNSGYQLSKVEMKLRLHVLPALVDSLKAISVRVENICGVITWIVIKACLWSTVV